MKLVLLFSLFVVAPVFCSDLAQLWDRALQSSAEERTHFWEAWINEAKKQNKLAPEAYFNLAYSNWQNQELALSVKNLLLSAQLRSSPLVTYGDLTLLVKIQRALLDGPSPIEGFPLKSFFFFSKTTKYFIWISVFWLTFFSFFLSFGFSPGKKKLSLTSLGVAALLLALALSIETLIKTVHYPLILNNNNKQIPLYRSGELLDEKPLLELPSGLLVEAQLEKGDWIRIEQPTEGWIKKEMTLPFPKLSLASSGTHAIYE